MTLPVNYIQNPAASHTSNATTWVPATTSLTGSNCNSPIAGLLCLLSILNTGAARVTPIKLVRPCYKPTQNPAMIPHLSQNKSQYPDSGSLVLINTLTSALPLVHSVSVSLASLFHRKCIWLRTLVGTDCFFCIQNTSPENC